MTRRVISVFGPMCLFLLLVVPTAAAADRYVALGDSYSSGTGTGDYGLARSCQRSRSAYPALVAARRSNLKLAFVACAGATTSDVLATQVSRVTAATRWVTITIGGNDIGFADVLGTCSQPGSAAGCKSAIDRARQRIRSDLPAQLDEVYGEIRKRAPDATVIVLGYPRLFTTGGCSATSSFRGQLSRLNQSARLLRDTLGRRVKAAGAGFRFSDAIPAFGGHEICSGQPWLNALARPIGDSFHPNRAGHSRGYTPLVLRAMGSR